MFKKTLTLTHEELKDLKKAIAIAVTTDEIKDEDTKRRLISLSNKLLYD